MRLGSLKALVAIPLFVSACSSSDVEDELAGETDEDAALDGKADGAVDGAYTYFEVRADLRKCVAPLCGGVALDRLNRTSTVCHDGAARTSCYTPELDWSESELSDEAQAAFHDALARGALSDGAVALVRGRFAPKTYEGFGNLGRFVVTEAWLAETDAVSDGVFVRAKDNGLRCIQAPCPSTNERALNTSRSANIAGIDWDAGGFTGEQISTFATEMTQPGGIILAGSRYTWKENGVRAKGRTATAVYRRLQNAAASGACYTGGCSGQICSDQEGVISTCEWREEYACYQDATCERQPDGECGWTPTAELSACLANP